MSARQSCSSHASRKQDVASNEVLVGRRIETEAPGAVSRHKKYAIFQPTEIPFGSFIDQKIRLDRVRFEKESKPFEELRIGDQRETVPVVGNLTSEYSLYLSGVIDMVDVSVCNHQQVEFCFKVAHPFGRTGRSIKENSSLRPSNEIGVRIENTANKSLNLKHSEWRFWDLECNGVFCVVAIALVHMSV